MLLVGAYLRITMPQVCDANCATCKKAGHSWNGGMLLYQRVTDGKGFTPQYCRLAGAFLWFETWIRVLDADLWGIQIIYRTCERAVVLRAGPFLPSLYQWLLQYSPSEGYQNCQWISFNCSFVQGRSLHKMQEWTVSRRGSMGCGRGTGRRSHLTR